LIIAHKLLFVQRKEDIFGTFVCCLLPVIETEWHEKSLLLKNEYIIIKQRQIDERNASVCCDICSSIVLFCKQGLCFGADWCFASLSRVKAIQWRKGERKMDEMVFLCSFEL